MSASSIIFYIIAAFILATGILAVTTRKIFRASIWLLFSLIGVASLYFWMQLEFLAAVQIIVYVGGIVVLIIFSIFLTIKSGEEMPKPILMRSIFSALAVIFGTAFMVRLISQYNFKAGSEGTFVLRINDIGTQMLDTKNYGYLLPFELISILLLAAMIGCIVIAIKQKEQPTTIS
ncbi:MAG: NADH-quinone oxidoreductase subunit J [Chitinophagaceae bacterium]|nr:NADH-quinone oxidoreductase subunit J [Chitinophagaceae bacterium]